MTPPAGAGESPRGRRDQASGSEGAGASGSEGAGESGSEGAGAARAEGGEGATRRPTPPGRRELDEARKAIRRDLDRSVYARRRRRDEDRRDRLERREWDPATEPGEWTVGDRTGVRRMPGTPEPLDDVLAGLLEDRGWSSRLRSSALFARWAEVVGDDVARNCEPIRLVGGVLVVATDSPSWATQLRYLSGQLQLAVNRALGEPVVERVEVQVRR